MKQAVAGPEGRSGVPREIIGLEELRAPVGDELAAVEGRLDALLGSCEGVAAEALGHLQEAGGKRLRPLVCLLSARAVGPPEACEAAGSPRDTVLRYATTVEAAHLASLLHDDVVDESATRRGRATVRGRWGNRAAVLVGDYLAALVYGELAADAAGIVGLRRISGAILGMCGAELRHAQMCWEVPSEQAYCEVMEGKTAGLFSVAAELGAGAVSGPDDAAALAEYGRRLGMAFQIADDLMDLYGDPKRMGKPIGSDVLAGVVTLPVIHALSADGDGSLARLIARIREGQSDPGAVGRIARLVARLGGRSYAAERLCAWAAAARDAVSDLAPGPAQRALLDLPEYVCQRVV